MARSLAFVTPSTSVSPSLVAPLAFLSPARPFCPCTHSPARLFQQKQAADDDEDFFLQRELARIESLDKSSSSAAANSYNDENEDDDDDWLEDFDLSEEDVELPDDAELEEFERTLFGMQLEPKSAETLEEALRQGVVPADAGVGSGSLSGDFGFDPLHVSDKDYIGAVQRFITNLIPGGGDDAYSSEQEGRPTALILRDYREAETRHGRLAMLVRLREFPASCSSD